MLLNDINQELSEYLTQPFRDRGVGGNAERHDSMDRRPPDGMDRPHLIGKPWYYGNITRAHCDSVLNQHGHDGDFLIRDSETNVRAFNELFDFIIIIIIMTIFIIIIYCIVRWEIIPCL